MRSEIISQFLQERVDLNDFPSAVYLVADNGEIVFHDAIGFAVVEPKRINATTQTIYDLASLTKPLVTGLLTSVMIERGIIDPNAPIGSLLPDLYVSGNAEITVNQLLMHTSGLPPWLPFYLFVERPEDVASEIGRTLQNAGQEPVQYSDLNFLTLGFIVEYLTGEDLGRIADQVFSAVELKNTLFNPLSRFAKEAIAASEKGNEYEKRTCLEMGYLSPDLADSDLTHFRKAQIWGEVHDGNAWFMQGIAGHAGLFSTAADVFKIALQFLPSHTTLLKPETCELFRTNFTAGKNEDRSVAFQLASTEGSTAGTRMSRESFGHTGFTGTSLWIDPAADRVFVLLTNRTHVHPTPFVNLNSIRRKFHDLAIEELEKNN